MLRLGLAIAAVVAVLDQISKEMIRARLDEVGDIDILPFFKLVARWNPGISFSLFNSGTTASRWILTVLALAIVGGLVVWLARVAVRTVAVALGLVIGGAIGNVIDRIQHHAVFDFALLYVGDWSWPAFNVADSAITIGVILLLIDALFAKPQSSK